MAWKITPLTLETGNEHAKSEARYSTATAIKVGHSISDDHSYCRHGGRYRRH
jgi:hypothetical protein